MIWFGKGLRKKKEINYREEKSKLAHNDNQTWCRNKKNMVIHTKENGNVATGECKILEGKDWNVLGK